MKEVVIQEFDVYNFCSCA